MAPYKDHDAPLGPAIVFWDFDGCQPQPGATGHGLVEALRAGLLPHCAGISSVKAFLDLSRGKQQYKQLIEELQSSAVQLVDCPRRDRRDTSDKALSVDIFSTCFDRPPPLTLCIVSQDPGLAPLVSVLRNRRYKVILLTTSKDDDGASTLTAQTDLVLPWLDQSLTSGTRKLIGPLRHTEVAPFSDRINAWAAVASQTAATPVVHLLQPSVEPFTPLVNGTQPPSESSRDPLIASKDPSQPETLAAQSVALPSPPLSIPTLPPKAQPNGITNGVVTSLTPSSRTRLRALPQRVSKAFLAKKPLIIKLAQALMDSSRPKQSIVRPLLLACRRFRDIVEPVAYRRLCVDSIPHLLSIVREVPPHLLGFVSVLEVDLPVRTSRDRSYVLDAVAQDEACVKLVELCGATISTLHILRGNWNPPNSTGISVPPPPSLRQSLSELPRLTHLSLRASAMATDADVAFGWLLIDGPYGQTPILRLRVLRIERLVGRPVPLYGVQLPLPPFISVPLSSATPRWGPPPDRASLLPALERLDLVRSKLAGDELARVFEVSTTAFEVLRLVDCDVPPSVIVRAVTMDVKASRPKRIEVCTPRGGEWKEERAVTLAKRLCAPAGVDLVLVR